MAWMKFPGAHRAPLMFYEHARIFPSRTTPYIDPFLLLDHFSIQHPDGFPDHPHRGFEIITYVLKGAVAHADSAGHQSVIPEGGAQHVTAGRGIVHSEMPGTDGIDSGLQLWINIPRSDKGMDPGYEDIPPDALPVDEPAQGVRRKWIVGGGSPVRTHRPMTYQDVEMAAGASYTLEAPAHHQGFIFVLDGAGHLGEEEIPMQKGDLFIWHRADGEAFVPTPVRAEESLRAVMVCGEPVGERHIFNGPFVD